MAEGGAVAHRMARSAIVTRWNVVVRCACVRACVRRSAWLRACVRGSSVRAWKSRACVFLSERASERASQRASVRAFVRSCVRAFVRSCVRAIAGERLSRGFAMAEGGTMAHPSSVVRILHPLRARPGILRSAFRFLAASGMRATCECAEVMTDDM